MEMRTSKVATLSSLEEKASNILKLKGLEFVYVVTIVVLTDLRQESIRLCRLLFFSGSGQLEWPFGPEGKAMKSFLAWTSQNQLLLLSRRSAELELLWLKAPTC